jgi:hypothetical protein
MSPWDQEEDPRKPSRSCLEIPQHPPGKKIESYDLKCSRGMRKLLRPPGLSAVLASVVWECGASRKKEMKQSTSDCSLEVRAEMEDDLAQGLSRSDCILVFSMLLGSPDTLVPLSYETVVGGRPLRNILELGGTQLFWPSSRVAHPHRPSGRFWCAQQPPQQPVLVKTAAVASL